MTNSAYMMLLAVRPRAAVRTALKLEIGHMTASIALTRIEKLWRRRRPHPDYRTVIYGI